VKDFPGVFHVYDTTLRDGAQQEGLRLTVNDKLRIAGLLDQLGVGFIEGGWPGANPNDTAFFETAAKELTLKNATLTAFGSTRRADLKVDADPLVQALLDARTEVICIVAKSHDEHVFRALKTTLEENLAMIRDTVQYFRAAGRRVFVDAEHYFNGYQANPEYSLEVVRVAAEAGAEVVVLCDTNGGMLPTWVNEIVVDTAAKTGATLGVHCHNDTGCAVANTLAAVDAGVMHVQGTINGHGERTGNADLITVIADLQLKYGWPVVPDASLADATRIAHSIAGITNVAVSGRQPYVGQSAFAHKGGLHASAIKVDSNLYQHIDPTLVGNGMRMLVSDMAGRANIQIKGSELGYDLDDRNLAARITERVKEAEMQGYSYESADASFERLIRQELGLDKEFFEVLSWRVLTSNVVSEEGDSEAVVKLRVGDSVESLVGEGQGPLNALDVALTKALLGTYPQVEHFELTDYRVRILDQGHGTDAIVRTLIDATDGERVWTTVGVGNNVIEASWEALIDSYRWFLAVPGGES
jgi:2-isopropylmalate synthase